MPMLRRASVQVKCAMLAAAMRLACDMAGRGEPIVFLHGVGSDRSTWRPQLREFGRDRLAVAADLRGHGGSPAAADTITLEGMAGDVAELIDGLGLGPAHVCGLSMGAIVALVLWRDRPDAVRSLALADSWAWYPEAAAGLPARLLAIDATPLPELARTRMTTVLAPDADPELLERSIAVMAAKDPACYRRSNEVLWGVDLRVVAATVAVPALVLVGELDRITPPGLSRELAELVPGAALAVLPGAGHLSNEENPDAFNRALAAHLAGVRHSGLE